MNASICIFCFQSPDNPKPWCADNPGNGCTYGFAHEFPDLRPKLVSSAKPKPVNKQVCVVCAIHVKNPASKTNGCDHVYPDDEVLA